MKPKTTKTATRQMGLGRPSEAKKVTAKDLADDATEARLNVTLPVIVHQRVKVRAAESRQTIREYILKLLEQDGIALE
jgi:hypothetical protein